MKRWSNKKVVVSLVIGALLASCVALAIFLVQRHEANEQADRLKLIIERSIEKDRAATNTPTPVKKITAQEIIEGVNTERVKAGLGALAVNAALNNSACMKADDMIAKNYWAHNSPDGLTPWYWLNRAGYEYDRAGENLGYGFASADGQISTWMNSEGHRKNILGNFFDTGVCIKYANFQDHIDQAVIVQHFGSQ